MLERVDLELVLLDGMLGRVDLELVLLDGMLENVDLELVLLDGCHSSSLQEVGEVSPEKTASPEQIWSMVIHVDAIVQGGHWTFPKYGPPLQYNRSRI